MHQDHHQKPNYFTIKRKIMLPDTGLFKIKKFSQSQLIFTAPETKCAIIVNSSLDFPSPVQQIRYQHKPLALDIIQFGQGGLGGEAGVGKFVIVGGDNGDIVVKGVRNGEEEGKVQVLETWKFKPSSSQERFINEIIHFPQNPHVLVNCYNNGSIALWSLLSGQRLHLFEKVHEKYTYKLRFQTRNILISCGHDCSIVRTDLQKQKYVSFYSHPLPVWCAAPIDDNQIASVGLFGRTCVWDVRANRMVQVCNNDAHQSSFVIARDKFELAYGDANMLVKWDRRKSLPQLLSQHYMNVSVQCMLFQDNDLYVCGRGKDLCRLQGTTHLESFYEPVLTKFLFVLKNPNQALQINSSNIQNLNEQEQQIEMEMEMEMEEDRSSGQQEEQDSEMQEQSQQLLTKKQQEKREKKQKLSVESVAKLSMECLKRMREVDEKWMAQQCQQWSSQQQKSEQVKLQKLQNNKSKQLDHKQKTLSNLNLHQTN